MGLLKCHGLREQASWMHTHLVSFVELTYIYSSSASVAWQSLLLMLTSFDGHLIAHWLSSSMWDFFLFCLLHTTSIIIFYSTYSAISMACAHVLRKGWKGWSALKSMNQLLGLSSGLCMMRTFCVTKLKHGLIIWFCRDELSLAMLFWEDIIAWLVCLKYYYFYVNNKILSWIFRIWTFMPQ